ncbi:uncharacterized protein LOC117642637 isoform X1 [Thrips palmi]|uniref:Uncharacterized protein LOC117642637 isoform X1 n=2 Tax=Thrips palmi TaxID=161013 RepID=A0A6P8YBC7_THRPL|nr:uncharacterized protein LOC117642637 isoform X1 [Thrips palmi]
MAEERAFRQVLVAIATAQGLKKPRFEIKAASGDRDGFTSSVFRTTISDDGPSGKAPINIITKTTSDTQEEGLVTLSFVFEGLAYQSILPALQDVANMTEPLPWPRCYLVSLDGLPRSISLEDLGLQGFVNADRSHRLDAAHCRLALRQLARYHGAGLALKHLRPEKYNELRRPLRHLWGTADGEAKLRPFFQAIRVTPDILKNTYPEGSAVYSSLKRLFDAFAEDNVSVTCPGFGKGYTFVHGDFHTNNVMFQYDKVSGDVIAATLIDFQLVLPGNPAMDLMTLLLLSGDKALRDAHWDSLLREYHGELQATLRAAGCRDPDEVHSWQLLQEQLSMAAMYGICAVPFYHNWLYADDETNKEVREFFANPEGKVFRVRVTPELKSHLEGVVEDVIRWGWLPSVGEIDRRLAAYGSPR